MYLHFRAPRRPHFPISKFAALNLPCFRLSRPHGDRCAHYSRRADGSHSANRGDGDQTRRFSFGISNIVGSFGGRPGGRPLHPVMSILFRQHPLRGISHLPLLPRPSIRRLHNGSGISFIFSEKFRLPSPPRSPSLQPEPWQFVVYVLLFPQGRAFFFLTFRDPA